MDNQQLVRDSAAIIYVFLLIKWHFDRIEQVQH